MYTSSNKIWLSEKPLGCTLIKSVLIVILVIYIVKKMNNVRIFISLQRVWTPKSISSRKLVRSPPNDRFCNSTVNLSRTYKKWLQTQTSKMWGRLVGQFWQNSKSFWNRFISRTVSFWKKIFKKCSRHYSLQLLSLRGYA